MKLIQLIYASAATKLFTPAELRELLRLARIKLLTSKYANIKNAMAAT